MGESWKEWEKTFVGRINESHMRDRSTLDCYPCNDIKLRKWNKERVHQRIDGKDLQTAIR